MTGFDDFINEFKKFKEGKDYKLTNEGKNYVIHSEGLKKSLREALSKWEGAIEVDSKGGENVIKHKLSQGDKLGLYQEKSNSSDEFTLISNEEKKDFNVGSPTLPKAPKAPKQIGKKPEGDYVSRTYRKDENTGRRSWEWGAKKGDEERKITIQEAENKLNSLRSLPDDIKNSFSQEISDLQKQIEESKQQAKEQVDVAKEQVQNNPFWRGWGK